MINYNVRRDDIGLLIGKHSRETEIFNKDMTYLHAAIYSILSSVSCCNGANADQMFGHMWVYLIKDRE